MSGSPAAASSMICAASRCRSTSTIRVVGLAISRSILRRVARRRNEPMDPSWIQAPAWTFGWIPGARGIQTAARGIHVVDLRRPAHAGRDLAPAADLELVEDVVYVVLDRRQLDLQACGDLLVAEAL